MALTLSPRHCSKHMVLDTKWSAQAMITSIILTFNNKLHYVNCTVNVFLQNHSFLLPLSSFVPANLFIYSSRADSGSLTQDTLCSDDWLPLWWKNCAWEWRTRAEGCDSALGVLGKLKGTENCLFSPDPHWSLHTLLLCLAVPCNKWTTPVFPQGGL